MSIELYIIRHGLAGDHGSYANDEQRPLTDEGQQKTRQVAKRLQALGLKFDWILTSPLVRARQTAEILRDVGLGADLEESGLLAPEGRLQDWLSWYKQWQESDGKCLALVGHEPNLSAWAEQLIWGDVRHHLVLKKAGVVGINLPDRGSPLGMGELFWLTPPRLLLG